MAKLVSSADELRPDRRALALVPGLESGAAPLDAVRLTGGSVNDVWRIDTRQGRFVLRLDAAASRRPGVDRQREYLIHQVAAQALIAPQIVARSPAGDVWVTEFIEARSWRDLDYTDASQLQRLAETLGVLHRLSVPAGLTSFNPAQLGHSYAAAGVAAAGAANDGVAIHNRLYADQLCKAIARSVGHFPVAATQCLVHGDPTAGNILDRRQLWLLDWEYAQLADPVFDVAAVLVYYPRARAHLPLLLAASGLAAAGRDGRLQAAARIHAALGWLWQWARGENPSFEAGILGGEWAN